MRRAREKKTVRVGVDTGGTFTDFVYQVEGRSRIFKLASTPADPSLAITQGLRRIAAETGVELFDMEVVHGTTVGTNALLQRRGARAALVTTAGFEDVLTIGRQARPRLYDLQAVRPEPLVPRALRFGVGERVAASGEVLQELDAGTLEALVRKLKRARVEAVAVVLLFSFVEPEHERRIERALAALDVPLSVSHRVLPEYREYERTSTVTINAYLQPLMGAYSKRLSAHAPRLRVMQSSGGSVSAALAADEPVRTVLSGPAGGVVGALAAARRASDDAPDIITFDMGGTSTDVSLCAAGAVRLTNEATVASLPVAVPIMDIHTVGAGGGSIARVDVGGSLRVGPESAGAHPGPACYGRGTLPTVTDANLVLGRFGGAALLGGDFPLDVRRAEQALDGLARAMGAAGGREVSAREAAQGVVRVVNAGMERALRAVSVERGYDPRRFTLLSFGGAGGLHAVELARALRIPRVVVPPSPGALSALGALSSDVVKDLSRTVMLETEDDASDARLERAFREMEREARAALRREGFAPSRQRRERTVAARYKGQSFELEIDWTTGAQATDERAAIETSGRSARARFDESTQQARRGTPAKLGRPNMHQAGLGAMVAAFHDAHRRRYGYAQEESAVEIVSARLRAVGVVEKLAEKTEAETETAAGESPRMRRGGETVEPPRRAKVYLTHGQARTVGVYARDELEAGARLRSPCIVGEYSSTTLVPAGARARIDHHGNLIIEP